MACAATVSVRCMLDVACFTFYCVGCALYAACFMLHVARRMVSCAHVLCCMLRAAVYSARRMLHVSRRTYNTHRPPAATHDAPCHAPALWRRCMLCAVCCTLCCTLRVLAHSTQPAWLHSQQACNAPALRRSSPACSLTGRSLCACRSVAAAAPLARQTSPAGCTGPRLPWPGTIAVGEYSQHSAGEYSEYPRLCLFAAHARKLHQTTLPPTTPDMAGAL
jgi:hypothetical protein